MRDSVSHRSLLLLHLLWDKGQSWCGEGGVDSTVVWKEGVKACAQWDCLASGVKESPKQFKDVHLLDINSVVYTLKEFNQMRSKVTSSFTNMALWSRRDKLSRWWLNSHWKVIYSVLSPWFLEFQHQFFSASFINFIQVFFGGTGIWT
jgi:hypothetical protein